MTNGFMQIVEQTYEEKLAMYMKCEKEELCRMLIECNRILDSLSSASIPFGKAISNIGKTTWATSQTK